MARIHQVKRARKEWTCQECGVVIAKGDPYLWWKPRYSYKHTRCLEHYPKMSDRTTSDKMARLYEAQESLESIANDLSGYNCQGSTDAQEAISVAQSSIEEAGELANEVGEEYQEAADNIHQAFTESEIADRCEEIAGECESWYSGIMEIDFQINLDEEGWQDAIEALVGEIQNIASDMPSY